MNKVMAFIFALFVFAGDQLSKWLVMEGMIRPKLGEGFGESLGLIEWLTHSSTHLPFTRIEILPFFNIVMVWNKGISFGMFNDGGMIGVIFLIALAVAIILFFVGWMFVSQSGYQRLAIALVIGGALGNVLDRARFGAVVDFLDVHAYGYHWPAFNISDSAIVIGVFLLIVQSFFFENSFKSAK